MDVNRVPGGEKLAKPGFQTTQKYLKIFKGQ